MTEMPPLKDFDDVLAYAIKREEESAATYSVISRKAVRPGLKKLLQELEKEEKNHKKILQRLARQKTPNLHPPKVPDLQISDGLADELPEADMSFQDLVIFAARKEQKAADLYAALAAKATNQEQKRLFDWLSSQEKTHKLRLESEYEKHVFTEN